MNMQKKIIVILNDDYVGEFLNNYKTIKTTTIKDEEIYSIVDEYSYEKICLIVSEEYLEKSSYEVINNFKIKHSCNNFGIIVLGSKNIKNITQKVLAHIDDWIEYDIDEIALKKRITNVVSKKELETYLETENKLLYRAKYDEMSQLYNRYATKELIDELLKNKNTTKKYYFCMLDIDGFKAVNDIYGHAAGDNIIKKFAYIIRLSFNDSIVIGRVGGDEFVVFGEYYSTDKLKQMINNMLEKTLLLATDASLDVLLSTSIGISFYPKDASNFQELYETADKAMYVAKKDFKNKYFFYEELK